MSADLTQLMQASLGPAPLPPVADPASAMGDPALGAPMPPMLSGGAGVGGGIGAFPSTDSMMLAQAVQETLAGMAAADAQMLEVQQQQAAMQAQPLIDQMLQNAAMAQMQPDPTMAMGAGPDPAMAFGEQPGIPPLPPEGMGY